MKTKSKLSILLLFLIALFSCNNSFKERKKKAELGDAEAQCILAEMYANGEGITTDNEQAFFWYK